MTIIGVVGRSHEKIIECLFEKVHSILNSDTGKDTVVTWIEDTGTVPFAQLGAGLTKSQFSQVQYIRVFDLEGCVDTLDEMIKEQKDGEGVLIFSHLGELAKDVADYDEIHGNHLVQSILTRLIRLSGYKTYIVGVDGMMRYYTSEIWSV